MITFGIPLRSKAASGDWDTVVKLFNNTLQSVYNQTNPDFRIIVACHDLPTLDNVYDSRVEFLVSDTPVPTSRDEMMLDKGYKVSMIARRIRELGGGYTMMVDSDDLISNRIAEFVDKHPGETGFTSRYGYIYNIGSPYVKRVLHLYRTCGSCSIVNYSVEDLPDSLPNDLWDDSPSKQWVIRMSHRKIPVYLKEHGRALKTIPFPTTIYIRNTGENHSLMGGNDLGSKRKLELLLRRPIPIRDSLKKEFGFNPF